MYTLDKELPKRVRIATYRKALKIYKDKLLNLDKEFYGMTGMGLCILLPCILWGLKSYLDSMPNGEEWVHELTPTAFPEIKDGINRLYNITGDGQKIKERIKILEEILKNK